MTVWETFDGSSSVFPHIKLCMSRIKAWSLLLKWAMGGKVSSRYLDRPLTKANLSRNEKNMGHLYLEEQLKIAYHDYYLAKGSARQTRDIYLQTLAEACAEQHNSNKETVYKTLLMREKQRESGRRIKMLRGKGIVGSTSMIQVQDHEGSWTDVMDKTTMDVKFWQAPRGSIQHLSTHPSWLRP